MSAGENGTKGSNGHDASVTLVKTTRPKIEFDLEMVALMGAYGASYQEMASQFKCSKQIIYLRMKEQGSFFDAYHIGYSRTKSMLRHRQIQIAMAGDVRMMTWLGMNLLDQRNVSRDEVKVSGTIEHKKVFTIRPADSEDESLPAPAAAPTPESNGHASPAATEPIEVASRPA